VRDDSLLISVEQYKIEDYQLFSGRSRLVDNHNQMLIAEDENYQQLAREEVDEFFLAKLASKGKGDKWWLGTNSWQVRTAAKDKEDASKLKIYQAFKAATLASDKVFFPVQKSASVTQQIIDYPTFIKQHSLVPIGFTQNRSGQMAVVNRINTRTHQLATIDNPQHIRVIRETITVNPPKSAKWHFALGSSKLVYYSENSKIVYAFVEVQPTLK
jgi:hypothetical protein